MSWNGAGWQRGNLAARAVSVSSGPVAAPTGPPVGRLLLVDTAASSAAFANGLDRVRLADARVLGWRDATTVLLDAAGRQVLAYHVDSGTVAIVATVTGSPAVLCLSDGGH
jgi:hypothetical protein